MFGRFFLWLEQGIYEAVMRGCRRAVNEMSSGEVVADDGVSALPHETHEAIEEEKSKPPKKKVAKRK